MTGNGDTPRVYGCWVTMVHEAFDGMGRYVRGQRLTHDPLPGDYIMVMPGLALPVLSRTWHPQGALILDVGRWTDVEPDSELPAKLAEAGWQLDPDNRLGVDV